MNTGSHQLGSWYELVLVAVYTMGDLVSRYIPVVRRVKLQSRKGLVIVVMSRFLLSPAFYFTARYGDQGWMIMLISISGLSNGYLTVCVLTAAPKGYMGPEQNAFGNLLVLSFLEAYFLVLPLIGCGLLVPKTSFEEYMTPIRRAAMSIAPVRLEGKFVAMVVCWVLGLGTLTAWNSMVTIGDYYYVLFPVSPKSCQYASLSKN